MAAGLFFNFLFFLSIKKARAKGMKVIGMAALECEICKADITSYKDRVQIIDDAGFTHTYCKECGKDFAKKIAESNASILESGKMGNIGFMQSRGSSVRF